MRQLTKDTTLCISLAGRPSNIGTRFHNRLYERLGLDFVYKAFTTDDLEGAMRGVRALGIRGVSVSMPFKEAVIPLLDHLEPSARTISSVNTVVNDGGVLTGSNTDQEAVAQVLEESDVDRDLGVLVRGSGGMARATMAALHESGFGTITVWARNAESGEALAREYDATWVADEAAAPVSGVLVNVTPLGMTGPHADALAFGRDRIEEASLVVDAVAFPSATPLVRAAVSLGTPVIGGAQIIALQAARQFERYTGLTPTPDQVADAAAYSREG